MGKIYVTGDCHANFRKFNTNYFPEQTEMTKDDVVIVCGDFGGVWHDSMEEKYWLDWLNNKPFTLLFCDGNHENFDRLYSDEFETVDFCGGKANKIRNSIYHLQRGHMFDICDKKIFVFGGASSHDMQDGILEPDEFKSHKALANEYNRLIRQGKMIRVNHLSWWKEEMPSDEEMKFGLDTLENNGFKADFIVSHCCPQHVASIFSQGFYKTDKLTSYFDKIAEQTEFTKWFFGHYHDSKVISGGKYIMLYDQIVRIA